MKYFILLILTFLVASCKNTVETKQMDGTYVDGKLVYVIIIDSCEYIRVGRGNETWGSHKGNCRFCAARDAVNRQDTSSWRTTIR